MGHNSKANEKLDLWYCASDSTKSVEKRITYTFDGQKKSFVHKFDVPVETSPKIVVNCAPTTVSKGIGNYQQIVNILLSMKDESYDRAILPEMFCQQSFDNVCTAINQTFHINNNNKNNNNNSNNTVGTTVNGSTPPKNKKN